ncbi:hypothetical protein PsorP6_012142 [Peronosclerospora sorghi]|uniref:Uncharacterized protein n=1 Tax=Peronosclerospora sorghi TaxID=230839 RepID=A0ACC0WMG7_9STRA|nr:hypothetical protein PsorP6_012142 [Peronosclerospora sorghi]
MWSIVTDRFHNQFTHTLLNSKKEAREQVERLAVHIKLNVNPRLISSSCFRLLSLVPEVQNDVEVMKPVLEELEVMRLSTTLGLMPSVRLRDFFEMGMLEASDLDDDFTLSS